MKCDAAVERLFCDFASAMSKFGAFETCYDVRSMVAIGGKANIARIALFGSD
jgi:hypothetical protein